MRAALAAFGVVAQQVAVVLDRGTAARGVHHKGLDRPLLRAAVDQRPPGVDVGAHLRQRTLLVVQVKAHRAAAPGLGRHHAGNARSVQHAHRGVVDLGRHRWLHAAGQQQHPARVHALR